MLLARNAIMAATKVGKLVVPAAVPDWAVLSDLLDDADADPKKVVAAADVHYTEILDAFDAPDAGGAS